MWDSENIPTYMMTSAFQTGKCNILLSATMSASCQEGMQGRLSL